MLKCQRRGVVGGNNNICYTEHGPTASATVQGSAASSGCAPESWNKAHCSPGFHPTLQDNQGEAEASAWTHSWHRAAINSFLKDTPTCPYWAMLQSEAPRILPRFCLYCPSLIFALLQPKLSWCPLMPGTVPGFGDTMENMIDTL